MRLNQAKYGYINFLPGSDEQKIRCEYFERMKPTCMNEAIHFYRNSVTDIISCRCATHAVFTKRGRWQPIPAEEVWIEIVMGL